MSRGCPFSCRTEGIPKKQCRDWREGNTCFVEDLSRAPNVPAPQAPRPPYYGNTPADIPGGTAIGGGYYGKPTYDRDECRNARHVSQPRVTVYGSRSTGNFFGDKYKIRGEIEGVCLAEAGYFERGRKRENISLVTTRDFRRFEFEVTVHASQSPEIRAYNVNGDFGFFRIDPQQLQGQGNAGPNFGGW